MANATRPQAVDLKLEFEPPAGREPLPDGVALLALLKRRPRVIGGGSWAMAQPENLSLILAGDGRLLGSGPSMPNLEAEVARVEQFRFPFGGPPEFLATGYELTGLMKGGLQRGPEKASLGLWIASGSSRAHEPEETTRRFAAAAGEENIWRVTLPQSLWTQIPPGFLELLRKNAPKDPRTQD